MPFDDEDSMKHGNERVIEMLARIRTQPPPSPKDARPDLPDWLDALCVRGLQKKPDDRFQTAAELGQCLRDGLANASRPA
jgi:serine/threonine-protein kinase